MTATQSKSTPKWKLAIIPVLGLVLVIVLFSNRSGTTNDGLKLQTTLKTSLEPVEATQPELAKLKTATVEAALNYDPFEMRTPLLLLTMGQQLKPGPTPEEIAAQEAREKALAAERERHERALMEKIQQLKVTLVIETDRGTAAIINNQKVYVGDEIQPNVVVTHIDHRGLRVNVLKSDAVPATSRSEFATE